MLHFQTTFCTCHVVSVLLVLISVFLVVTSADRMRPGVLELIMIVRIAETWLVDVVAVRYTFMERRYTKSTLAHMSRNSVIMSS